MIKALVNINCIFCWSFFFSSLNLSAETRTSTVVTDQQIIENVYQQLKIQIGDKRKNWPTIKIWAIKDQVATFMPKENTIYLDQAAVNTCRQFTDKFPDALSFIIGHELTHFYQTHNWKSAGFAPSKTAFIENIEEERQADIYGTFIAQQAGYQAIKLVPSILEKIYAEYGLPLLKNKQYPTLIERKELAAEACQMASNLLDIYQTANFAMVIGKYEMAYQSYEFVRKHLKFKELYYNIGMSSLLAYYHWNDRIQFLYSFSIDANIPLTRNSQMRHPQLLLAKAVESFQIVKKFYDDNYLPARLQLITALDWQQNIALAKKEIMELEQQFSISNYPDFLLTIGNFYGRQNDKVKAMGYYKSLLNSIDSKNKIGQKALTNLDYLKKGVSLKENKLYLGSQTIERNIDQIEHLPDFIIRTHSENIEISINATLTFQALLFGYSAITKLTYDHDFFKLQRIESTELKSNRDIGIGSTSEQIYSLYSNQSLGKVSHTNGYYIVLFEKGLIFKMNKENKVEEWALFCI